MNLVIVKLCDVLARAGFVVTATYLLAIEQAGQFGIINTLIGLFAFAFGWERHIDIQRRMVGAPPAAFDQAVRSIIPFWGVNYLWMLPIFAVIAGYWANLHPSLLLAISLVAVCEQIANSAYNLSVVDQRYRPLIGLVAIKNGVLLAGLLATFWFVPKQLVLTNVLLGWAGVSGVGTMILALMWERISRAPADPVPSAVPSSIGEQYRASMHHFLIGALAVVSLQFDRLAVGAILPLDQVGSYFRHVVLVSFAYQFFNVASYNRRLAEIFETSRRAGVSSAMAIIRREYGVVLLLSAAGLAMAALVDWATGYRFTGQFQLSLLLGTMLLFGALFRIGADFLALILNARMAEATLFKSQLLSFVIGGILLLVLTYMFGLFGAAVAVILTMALYSFLNLFAVRRLPAEFTA